MTRLALDATERLALPAAVQPAYMHPYAAARMIASLGTPHGRRLALTMLAGGLTREPGALGDATPLPRALRAGSRSTPGSSRAWSGVRPTPSRSPRGVGITRS